ncbi:uncharacterized protein LOC109709996 isoform X2 [Ananas comosus]|uniref:Uncharacterized protein LOC109709996 isoform X2 n=1 Tax=Ananas comosus TaxID=4615 RepID=A0A6P5EWN2_ANACO|nr:uncharacterized protein LOC109709996 isoform X2 [Ananas comosus]
MAKGCHACREVEEETENNFIPFLTSQFVVSSPCYYSAAAASSRAIPLLSLGEFDFLHPSSTSVHAEETLPSPHCSDYPRRLWSLSIYEE